MFNVPDLKHVQERLDDSTDALIRIADALETQNEIARELVENLAGMRNQFAVLVTALSVGAQRVR